jgi:uncharacterized protein involved in exopolysaccharide biosynthesis
MEEEIDLRQYVMVLLRRWKWIAGLALVAAVVAFVVSMLLPPVYEAEAVVIITQPRYLMQFDPRFATVQDWTPAYKAFPTLATSDGVLQSVVDTYTPSPEASIEAWGLQALSGMIGATSKGDPSLVVLDVRSRSPEDAAAIANVWAAALVAQGNGMYSVGEEDVAFFEGQLAQAEHALDEADAALVEFQARNQADIITVQLESSRQAQADYLSNQRAIASIVQNAQGLRDQLAQQPTDGPSSFADDLTALFLQIAAFNTQTSNPQTSRSIPESTEGNIYFSTQASEPVQLQVSSAESLSNRSVAEQIAFLDDLVSTLEARSTEIDDRLAELSPRIMALQQQFEEFNVEEDRLTRARDLGRETYMTLARKTEEARIAATESNGVLQVGSYAASPERAVSPRKLLNTAVAGVLGLMVGVLGAFAMEWWRGEEREDKGTRGQGGVEGRAREDVGHPGSLG